MSIYLGNNLIAPNQSNAANKSLSNLDSTGQSILNSKADTDLSNTTDQAKILMSSMGMPSDTYIDLTLGASDSQYTAPANGWFCLNMSTNAVAQYINMQNVSTGFSVEGGNPASGNWIRLTLPVLKNDVVLIGYSANEVKLFRFFYAQGSESEAN